MPNRIFISHSSADRARVISLVDAIEARGIECWVSHRDIPGGDNYGDVIVDAIEQAPAMVLIFSANADGSAEIKKEIALASQRGIPVIPVRIEDVSPSKAFRYELATRQWIDVFGDNTDGLDKLVERLASTANGALLERSRPPAAPARVETKSRPSTPILAPTAVAVAAIVAGAIWTLRPSVSPIATPTPTALAHNGSTVSSGLPISEPALPSARTTASPQQAPTSMTAAPAPAESHVSAVTQPKTVEPTTTPVTQTPAPAVGASPPSQTAEPAIPPTAQTPPTFVAATPPAEPGGTGETQPQRQTAGLMPPRVASPSTTAFSAGAEDGIAAGPPLVTRGGEMFRDCEDCPVMVVIPAGRGAIGSPYGEPGRDDRNETGPHEVLIRKPFALGRYTVTFMEWDTCVADGFCHRQSDMGFGRGRRPAIFVSWKDAQGYAQWLSRKTGKHYRLPSESEWEYAARACLESTCSLEPFWFGTVTPAKAVYDWRFAYESSPKAYDEGQRTEPVDRGNPNPFGLFNILGNVRQWTLDCWSVEKTPTPSDGSAVGAGDCSERVTRGGSYSEKPSALRAGAREWAETGDRTQPNIGFRLVRELD